MFNQACGRRGETTAMVHIFVLRMDTSPLAANYSFFYFDGLQNNMGYDHGQAVYKKPSLFGSSCLPKPVVLPFGRDQKLSPLESPSER